MSITVTDRIIRLLCNNGWAFSTKPVQHGRQVIFNGESVLTLYDTGTVQWQGRPFEGKRAIEKLIKTAKRQVVGKS